MAQKCARRPYHREGTACGAEEQTRVLIVDDEASILFAYRRLIEGCGYVVDTCESLTEAVERITTCPYFAVITDLRLTGSDTAEGLTVLATVRDHQPQARAIVMTGFGGEQDALALGASFFFKKPLEPSVILEALRHLKEEAKSNGQRSGSMIKGYTVRRRVHIC